jgi:ABC-type tungstate transport system permease subunit
MDLTIKGIPTQAIADRIMNVAQNLIDAYIETEAKKLSEEKQAQVLTDKEAFRTANNLPSLKAVEDGKDGLAEA